MKNRRLSLFFAVVLTSGGCTFLTDVDTSFLTITNTPDDAGLPDCTDAEIVETRESCFDGCDNDGDFDVDCDDEDCEHYCCNFSGHEWLACNDQCDNDRDGFIDCDDPACSSETHCTDPPDPEVECSNGVDDDEDGSIDCQDEDCSSTEFCCGSETPHVDQANQELDGDYWSSFQGRADPHWSDLDRVSSWNDVNGVYGGAATDAPINLDFGLRVNFNTLVREEIKCFMPWDCDAFSGIALGPSAIATSGQNPIVHLSVLVTSGRRVVVTRGPIGGGRILHTMGLEPPLPGSENDPLYSITVDLMPAWNDAGENGYRMRLSSPLGVEVCHADGTILGCNQELEWVSEELVLYEENNVLLNDERGSHLMVLGHGEGVEFSDRATETISVSLRSCANPTAWEPAGEDDRVDNSFLCWATAGLGSGSITPSSEARVEYVMVVEGTTEEILPAGLGTNNFSLGWLDMENDTLERWSQEPVVLNENIHRRLPIDTDRDLNCEGLTYADWPHSTCETLIMMESPSEQDEQCRIARSHRSPHVIDIGSGSYRVLFSQAKEHGSLLYDIAAADYTRRNYEWDMGDLEDHLLTTSDIATASLLQYRSLRDPVAICHPDYSTSDSCGGVYMVLLVGEPDSSDGAWSGDDVIYIEYDVAAGFDVGSIFVVIDGDSDAPLAYRYLAEPWIIWDERTEQYFFWVTTNLPNFPTQVDLYTITPAAGSGADNHPLVPNPEPNGAVWTLYPGSPVLTVRDLELLYPSADLRAADCSGSCEIGGVTGVVVPSDITGRDTLHLWVSVAERPDTDAPPVFHLRHLVQPFGLP